MSLRCLIVDDSKEFLASAARLLDSQGVEVVGVATGYADGLRLAEELTPDIALIDVDLGEEDGIQLARELTSRVPAMRTILISAHDLDDLDLTEAGANVVFLPKNELGADALEAILG
jgi:two-component system, NarL family, nitrate/nitrite response regulator NarL